MSILRGVTFFAITVGRVCKFNLALCPKKKFLCSNNLKTPSPLKLAFNQKISNVKFFIPFLRQRLTLFEPRAKAYTCKKSMDGNYDNFVYSKMYIRYVRPFSWSGNFLSGQGITELLRNALFS